MALTSCRFVLAVCLALLSLTSVQAALHDRLHANQPIIPGVAKVQVDSTISVQSVTGETLPPLNTTYYFDQLVDHSDPSKGTFKQRYWHTWEFYKTGGPIILMTPGEVNADGFTGYLTNRTINGLIAQQENGATIVLEHRFFGLSNPYPDLTVSSLRLLTIHQAVNDLVYFAQNVNLPMPGGNSVKPNQVPWILVGGSYSGALTAWTMVNKPGIFWAGHASSAVVEAIVNFWRYFEPIREFMPKNCSADVEAVIGHVDTVFSGNNQTAINYIKNLFGLGVLTHLDDVAGALRNNLWDWQSLQPETGSGATFFQFCDALEVKNGVVAPATGWGLDHALPAWGKFFNGAYTQKVCEGVDIESCFGTYDANSTLYTNTTIDNASRSWTWMVCNEVGYFQEGAPVGTPSLVTRLVQPPYDERQCALEFPAAFPKPPVPNVQATNTVYRGWNVKVDRLVFANGHRDPWREATMSASTQNLRSTSSQPILIGDGFHTSDMITKNAAVDPTIALVQKEALAYFAKWIKEWPSNTTKY